MEDFGRVLTAMVTPFDEKLNVDYKKAGQLAKMLESSGSDGIIVSGTTGESPTLTFEEKVKLYETVREVVSPKTAVIAGTGTNSTETSIKLTKEAEAVGVDGIMAVVPYYNKPSQEGLYQHFKAVAASTKLPVMLYNVPPRTSLNMKPETVFRLSQIDNIVALKEAANDVEQATEIKRICSPDFKIYSGNDSFTLPLLSLGGYGVVSVASHIAGNEIKEMINHFFNGNLEKSLEIHIKLFPLFKVLFIASNPVPVKTALKLKGFDVGGVRLPLVNLTEKETEILKKTLEQY
ncbi:MAG: 4-hydroxy-tetrahydrodipicolinate synthase [Clostridia bacterium 41_269]|nr:MAG: 4-hydroxy-tetrahydrodipicolinate synthase [Clostridia bacterium 41_269]